MALSDARAAHVRPAPTCTALDPGERNPLILFGGMAQAAALATVRAALGAVVMELSPALAAFGAGAPRQMRRNQHPVRFGGLEQLGHQSIQPTVLLDIKRHWPRRLQGRGEVQCRVDSAAGPSPRARVQVLFVDEIGRARRRDTRGSGRSRHQAHALHARQRARRRRRHKPLGAPLTL